MLALAKTELGTGGKLWFNNKNAFVSTTQGYCTFLCLTLDAPLEERLTSLTRPDAVVVAGRVVVTHRAVVQVCLPAGRHHGLLALLRASPRALADR